MIFKGYGTLRSVTKRTWYKENLVRIVIDVPAESITPETVLKLNEFHRRDIYIKLKETEFEQKEVSDFAGTVPEKT